MPDSINRERRAFLKTSTAVSGSLVLGFSLSACGPKHDGKTTIKNLRLAQQDLADNFVPNMWLRINTDNTIVIQSACSEMGQGVMTSIPMLVAEELEADMSMIRVEFAPAHDDFANPNTGYQITGGSQSIRGYWKPMREAGAAAKDMLIGAAALLWGVDSIECYAKKGRVIHIPSNKSYAFGQLAEHATKLKTPDNVTLKAPQHFKLIGTPQPRLDAAIKINGTAVFGIDVKLPDLLVACVERCPVFGGTIDSVDDSKTKKIAGVRHVIVIDSGVAVIADHFWAAKKGREALTINWDEGENAKLSSEMIRQKLKLSIGEAKSVRDDGDVSAALENGEKQISAVFETPYLAHTCMEPMNCTADVQATSCQVWVPTQAQEFAMKVAKDISGLVAEKIQVHTTFLGGGFGRRAEKDFIIEALQCSNAIQQPVKVIWTREDDVQHDYYRPVTYNELTAAIDKNNHAIAWQHNIASPSILERYVPLAKILLRGKDKTSTEGASNLPYAIANIAVNYAWVNTGIPVGFWRSVGNSQNGFITECFIDELANLAKQDAFEFRKRLLKNHARHLAVLELAIGKAGWNKPLPEGHFHGMAVMESFGSFVAQVAEVSIQSAGTLPVKVHKITCAVDCGIVVNPDTVEAQLQSGIIFGLTAALSGEIGIENGRVMQSNFHDYPALRINEVPDIEVHLIKSAEPVGGVGEIGVPPIAPAVANAVFAATGKRVRKLPIRLDELVSV